MFRMSRRLDYGLQLMIALANEAEGKPQSTASLAKNCKFPFPFLHQIGQDVVTVRFDQSISWPAWWYPPEPPGRYDYSPANCRGSGRSIALQPCPECNEQCERFTVCSSQFAWNELEQVVVNYLSGVRLDMLAQTAQTLPIFAMQMLPSKSEALQVS